MNTRIQPHELGPRTGIRDISAEEADLLAAKGYVARAPLFRADFANDLRTEIDRLICNGVVKPSRDRLVCEHPTEWIVSLGVVWGNGPDSEVFEMSPLLRKMFLELQRFGRSYNAIRDIMIKSERVRAEEAPALAVEGAELHVNLTIAGSGYQWSGFHMHRDMLRFNGPLQALGVHTVRHAAVRARAFTFSGYSCPQSPDGTYMNDAGGALVFFVRSHAKQPGDNRVFDVVPADHNTGAFFFPHTTHGVGRMLAPGSKRYSFQVFYPAERPWTENIKRRIESGELARELKEAAQTGTIGWR